MARMHTFGASRPLRYAGAWSEERRPGAAAPMSAQQQREAGSVQGRRDVVCVVGHVTRDVVAIAGRAARTQTGGTAYYAAATLKALGTDVIVVTRLAPADEAELLAELRSFGVAVRVGPRSSPS